MSSWHSAERTGRVRKGPAPRSSGCSAPSTALARLAGPAPHPPRTWGDSPPEEEAASENLLVLLEGNVPTHHIIEQYAQRPHRCRAPVVAVVADPFRGAVYPGAWGGGGTRALGRPPQGPAPSPALSLSPCEARAGSRPPEILLVITLEKPGGCGLPSWPARPGEGRVT